MFTHNTNLVLYEKPELPAPSEKLSTDLILSLAQSVVECYKDVKIASEAEQTKRAIAREQARIAVAAFEAHTAEFLYALQSSHACQMEFIKIVEELACKPNLDDNSLALCRNILDTLQKEHSNLIGQIGTFTINR